MTEVPENAEHPDEGEGEPWAQEPPEAPGSSPDRVGYVARLQALPVWPEVLTRLTRGDSALSVATWLVNEQGFECGSLRSLSNQLTKYRQRLPHATTTAPAILPSFIGQDGGPPQTSDEFLRVIRWAIRQQRARIKKSRKTEKDFPMAHRQVTDDLELVLNMAVQYANLAMRLGLAKEVPQQLNVASLGVYADLATLTPAGQGRVLEWAAYVLRKAGTQPLPKPGDGDGDGDGDARGGAGA